MVEEGRCVRCQGTGVITEPWLFQPPSLHDRNNDGVAFRVHGRSSIHDSADRNAFYPNSRVRQLLIDHVLARVGLHGKADRVAFDLAPIDGDAICIERYHGIVVVWTACRVITVCSCRTIPGMWLYIRKSHAARRSLKF